MQNITWYSQKVYQKTITIKDYDIYICFRSGVGMKDIGTFSQQLQKQIKIARPFQYMQQLSTFDKQPITAMSGFTRNLQCSQIIIQDNTLNDSKMDRSQFNPNKSTLLRELKSESLDKIVQKLQKLVLGVVFEKVYWWGIKMKRVEDKTPINIYKNFYKINLMLKLKLSAKLSWAFHAINKFTKEFDMGKLNKMGIEQQQQKNGQTIAIEQGRLNKVEVPQTKNKEQNKNVWQQNRMNALCEKLFKIISHKQIEISFKNIQKEEYDIQKKLYLLQLIAHVFNIQIRHHFLQIYNSNLNVKSQQILMEGQRQREDQKMAQILKQLEQKKEQQAQKQQTKIPKQATFAPTKVEKVIQSFNSEPSMISQKMQKQNEDNKMSSSDKNLNEQKHTNPPLGLKFNRCLKKTSQRKQMVFSNPKAPIIRTNMVKFRSSLVKSYKVQTALCENSMFRQFVLEDFIYSQRTYHLAAQQIKMELPDIQDKTTIFEIDQMLDTKKSNSLNSKLTFNKRLHKLQSKSPLQFSNKRNKSKNSSIKSKKSVGKGSQTENDANQQSLKSYYYFPEKQNYGKAEVSIPEKPKSPTKYIGSTRWTGHTKKRTTTQTSGRSNEKANPYLQELKEKVSRKPTQTISLHKMIERSLSGGSTSRKASKQKDKQKEFLRKIQTHQSQYSTNQREKNQKQQKTSRNISPQPQQSLRQQRSVEQLNFAGVPKEWHIYKNSQKNLMNTRVRESKPLMQFHKIEYNALKL